MEKREYDNEAVYHVTYFIHADRSVVKFWKFQEHIHRPPNMYIWPEHNPGFIYLFIYSFGLYISGQFHCLYYLRLFCQEEIQLWSIHCPWVFQGF